MPITIDQAIEQLTALKAKSKLDGDTCLVISLPEVEYFEVEALKIENDDAGALALVCGTLVQYATFNSVDYKYKERSGETVRIVGPLAESEYDRYEVGPMFVVRFSDGTEAHVFEDELSRPEPELLKTCKMLLYYYEAFRDKSPVGPTEQDDIEAARKLIASFCDLHSTSFDL